MSRKHGGSNAGHDIRNKSGVGGSEPVADDAQGLVIAQLG